MPMLLQKEIVHMYDISTVAVALALLSILAYNLQASKRDANQQSPAIGPSIAATLHTPMKTTPKQLDVTSLT
jgi:hypothetical protein